MLEFNICYSSDSNYAEQMAVSMASILSNATKQENINFYILDGGLTEQDKSKLELLKNIKDFKITYVEINYGDFKNCPMLKEKNEEFSSYHVTLPTYFRFKLASFLPSIDKILYFDCDVIVRNSLEELYTTSIKDVASFMILDAESNQEAKRLNLKNYFNAGVMLINLDYWRKNDVENRLFKFAKENKETILWQDQDVINIVLKDEIKKISEKWNFQYFLYEKIDVKQLSDIKIFHIAGRFKPWLIPFEHPIYSYYYYYLLMTPWKNNVLKYKEMANGKTLKNNIGGRKTNILINATDADIQEIYKEIDKVYKSFDNLKVSLDGQTDLKLKKVYEEITKNYDFTKNIVSDAQEKSAVQVDKKLEKVYEEITKNYDFAKNIVSDAQEKSAVQVDEKILKVYNEISKNNEYTQEKIASSKAETIELIDNSIKTVIESCETKVSKLETSLNENKIQNKNQNEEVKLLVQNIQTELSQKIGDVQKNVEEQTGKEIGKVYEEITKNYEYTNTVRDDLKSIVFQSKQEITSKISSDVQNLYDRIVFERQNTDDNINRIEELLKNEVERSEQSFLHLNKELQKNTDYIEALVDEVQLKLKYDIENVSVNTQQLQCDTKNIQEDLQSTKVQLQNLNNDFWNTKNTIDNRISDIYSYTNEQMNKALNEINENYRLVDAKVEKRSYENYLNVQNAVQQIDGLRYVIDNKTDKKELIDSLEIAYEKIQMLEVEYQKKLSEMKNVFDDELNKQRIKYEKKLIDMENIISSLDEKYQPRKKNIFTKLKERLNNK